MIIGGGSRSNYRWFSKHLMNGRDNELVRVAEIRGLPADNLVDAFEEMRMIASASPQCTNFFYHADLNTRADERLTEREWDKAVDTLEKNLGLEGQSRVVVEHDKNGRIHRHVLWSRIDPDTMRAIPDSNNYDVHMRTADELERIFGHEPTPRGRGPGGPNPKNYEVFRGKESGISPYDVKAEITELYHQSDTGQAFAAALDERGYILAKGDRRDFVVIDQAGDEHSLARRVAGAKAADIRDRLKDVDREALPSVEEARELARERAAKQDDVPAPKQPASAPEKKLQPGAFDVLAEELLHAAKDAVVEVRKEPPPETAPVLKTEPTVFDHLAEDIAHEAKEAALIVEQAAAAAAREPETSPFRRFAQEIKQAMLIGGGALSLAESLKRLAQKNNQSSADLSPADRESTPFRRFARERNASMQANGGEPYMRDGMTFWQRSAAILAAARDRAVTWVQDRFQELVRRTTPDRSRERDDSGLER